MKAFFIPAVLLILILIATTLTAFFPLRSLMMPGTIDATQTGRESMPAMLIT